ncbi:MAG: hypothetical protein AAGJ31_07035 [Verrucomicrobiota bacterium]
MTPSSSVDLVPAFLGNGLTFDVPSAELGMGDQHLVEEWMVTLWKGEEQSE